MLKYILLTLVLFSANISFAQDAQKPTEEKAMAFKVESSTFKEGELLPQKTAFDGFDCGGQNILPHLKWSNAPAGTKSFVITEYDPDAPTVSGFWHWGIFNIPASVSEIAEGANQSGSLPAGSAQIFTDYGSTGYGGSCPPVGDKPHHYHFTVYALSTEKLELTPATTTGAFLMFNIRGSILAEAKITGMYERKQ